MKEKTAWKWRKKNRLKTKEKRAKQSDKIKKTLVAVFAEYEFDWTTRQNLKKAARKHKKPWKVQENYKN